LAGNVERRREVLTAVPMRVSTHDGENAGSMPADGIAVVEEICA